MFAVEFCRSINMKTKLVSLVDHILPEEMGLVLLKQADCVQKTPQTKENKQEGNFSATGVAQKAFG